MLCILMSTSSIATSQQNVTAYTYSLQSSTSCLELTKSNLFYDSQLDLVPQTSCVDKTKSSLKHVPPMVTASFSGLDHPGPRDRGPRASVNSTDHSLLCCVLQRTTSRAWATQGPDSGAWSIRELNRQFFTMLCTTMDNFSGLGHSGPRFGGPEHP